MSGTAAGKRTRKAKAPDVLGTAGRVRVLADLLRATQEQRFRIEALQIANGHEPGDPVAGLPATDEGGVVQSYRLLISQCDEQVERLRESFPDAWAAVERLVQDRDRA